MLFGGGRRVFVRSTFVDRRVWLIVCCVEGIVCGVLWLAGPSSMINVTQGIMWLLAILCLLNSYVGFSMLTTKTVRGLVLSVYFKFCEWKVVEHEPLIVIYCRYSTNFSWHGILNCQNVNYLISMWYYSYLFHLWSVYIYIYIMM